jgi:hypothetical protein
MYLGNRLAGTTTLAVQIPLAGTAVVPVRLGVPDVRPAGGLVHVNVASAQVLQDFNEFIGC